MHDIRGKFPHLARPGSMHTDPPEEQVRYKVGQSLQELRREFMAQAYDKRLPIFDEMVARLTTTENETLDDALTLARSLRAVLLSPDSPLPGCNHDILRRLVLHVRKEIVASGGPTVIAPSQTQLSATLESLLSVLESTKPQ